MRTNTLPPCPFLGQLHLLLLCPDLALSLSPSLPLSIPLYPSPLSLDGGPQAHGFPKILGVLTHLDHFKVPAPTLNPKH